MDQGALPAQVDDTHSESVGSSRSLVESMGSVEIGSWKLKPPPPLANAEVSFPRPEKGTKSSMQLMQFSKGLLDVPVQVAWEIISNHKQMVHLIPGIMESFDYIEGEGGAGSVYVAIYSPECVRPGERKYQMNEVEVRDEAANLYVVKSVGGKYQQRYNAYTTSIRVYPDEVLGLGSSIVEFILEYEVRNQNSPPPVDSGNMHMLVLNKLRDRHHAVNRVERPVASQTVIINFTKRLRLQVDDRRLAIGDELDLEPEDRSRQRRRKPRVQVFQIQDDEPEDRSHQRRRKPRVQVIQIQDDNEPEGRSRQRRRKPGVQVIQIQEDVQHSQIHNDDQQSQMQIYEQRALIQAEEQHSEIEADGQLSPVQDDEDSDQESKKTQKPGKKTAYFHQSAGSGLVFRRRRPR